MLVRVALHQTRLRTPGLGLDPKGVALGAKGLVLLPGLDRLVAFLGLYTRHSSLEDLLRSLKIDLVKSKLGAREVVLSFAADNSDRMDRVADVARLAGGYTFTGTSRHFVQYRDKAAPFGYDVSELLANDAPFALYHSSFSQLYAIERSVELRSLLLRLAPQPDPSTHAEPGSKWIVAESGLGPALISYFIRSGVDAEVGLAEWPPASSFDDEPVTRYVFRVPDPPARMMPLLTSTPGLSVFHPVADGAAVELGARHPVNLRACPVFERDGLVLFRRQGDPLDLPKLPALGAVQSFARVALADEGAATRARATTTGRPGSIELKLRMVPTTDPWRGVTASWIPQAELPMLRRMAYLLAPETLRRTSIAFAKEGAFLRMPTGIEAIPVGQFYREVHPSLFIAAGYDALPAVSPEVLMASLAAPAGVTLFIARDAGVIGVDASHFVPLETALLEAQSWALLPTGTLEPALATEIPELVLTSPGLLPMGDVGREAPEEPG